MTIELPAHASVDEFAASMVEQPVDFAAFAREFKTSGAEQFLSASSLLFIVNDGYRHTPTSQVLDWLDQLSSDVLDRAHFLIATGSHKPPTEAHYRGIFGAQFERVWPRVHYHVAADLNTMVKVGVDSFGGDVYVNRLIQEFDRIAIIGSVEPHYFAGYTGGRKAIFPGVCDLATTERNHNLANSLDAMPLRLKGNPVAEHLQSLMPFVSHKAILSIQLVADAAHHIGRVFFGDIENSFTRAVEYAEKLYARRIDQPYDAVLCEILPPLDKNMYQAQKALENCQSAVADGGTIIVVSACEEGIGSDFFMQEAADWDALNNRPGDGTYRFGSHKLTRMIKHQRRIDVRLKSVVPNQTVQKVFYKPVSDISALLEEKLASRTARVAVVHDAAHTVLASKQFTYPTNSQEVQAL